MKLSLLSCLAAGLVAIFINPSKLHAQACTVSNLTVKLNSSGASGPNCIINVDISWDQSNNSGNKFTNVHLWTLANYPSPALTYSNPPTATDLVNALGTIVISNPTSATPTLATSYPNGSVTMLSATGVQKVYVSGTGNGTINRFTVTGISLTIPGACSVASTIKADLWSSNSASDNAVQCATIGASLITNDPGVSGLIICGNPRQFIVNLTTLGASSLQATYIVYADEAPLGTLDASDPVVYTSGTVTIPASGSGTYTSGPISFSNTYATSNLWVRVQVTGYPNSTVGLLTNSCGTLPVKLVSFTSRRTDASSVLLKWQTAAEENNKGFDILRKDGSGDFRTIAFVATKASGGNSSVLLDYQFSDVNSYDGETQYRLAQIDLDGKKTYSPIVMVRGYGSSEMSVLVYPNPAYSSSAMLVFNNTDKKNITVVDISGRRIKMETGITTNNYSLSGMQRGMYFIKIIEQSSGKMITTRVIIR
jgi:hypothetical protein